MNYILIWSIIGAIIVGNSWDNIMLNEKVSTKKKIIFFFIHGPIVWISVSFVCIGFGFYKDLIEKLFKKDRI